MKRHANAARSRLAIMYTLDTFVSLISSSLSLCLTNRILCCVVVCTRRVVRWGEARRRGDHIVSIPVSSRRPVPVPRDSPGVLSLIHI